MWTTSGRKDSAGLFAPYSCRQSRTQLRREGYTVAKSGVGPGGGVADRFFGIGFRSLPFGDFFLVLLDAKLAASQLILKYVARASVAVPFVIVTGFALAAVTVMLVERFGHVMTYWLVAAMGVIAFIVVAA
jgi:hypothetical protein